MSGTGTNLQMETLTASMTGSDDTMSQGGQPLSALLGDAASASGRASTDG